MFRKATGRVWGQAVPGCGDMCWAQGDGGYWHGPGWPPGASRTPHSPHGPLHPGQRQGVVPASLGLEDSVVVRSLCCLCPPHINCHIMSVWGAASSPGASCCSPNPHPRTERTCVPYLMLVHQEVWWIEVHLQVCPCRNLPLRQNSRCKYSVSEKNLEGGISQWNSVPLLLPDAQN